MDFSNLMHQVADEIKANYSEYDSEKSILVVRLEGGRYQTVFGTLESGDKYHGKQGIEIKTKVCDLTPELDFKSLLEENAKTCHAKFVIEDDALKVEGSAIVQSANKDILKEIIIEVASLGDFWENKLTGQDVN